MIPGSYSENQHEFFKPSPESNVFSLPRTTSKWTQEHHFIWWVKVTGLQNSKKRFEHPTGPSVVLTANGTTRTTEEATVWTRLFQVQLLKESPVVLSMGKLCEKNGHSYEWHPGQPSYLFKNGRNIECKTDNHIPLVVPGVKHLITRPEFWTTCSRHELWATMRYKWKQNYQNGFKCSLKDLTRGSSGSTDVSPVNGRWHRQHFFLPRILQQNLQVKSETSSVLVQSGLQESRRTECCCCLRNVQDLDLLADGQTLHFGQRSWLWRTWNNARRKLETRRASAMPCKVTTPANPQRFKLGATVCKWLV